MTDDPIDFKAARHAKRRADQIRIAQIIADLMPEIQTDEAAGSTRVGIRFSDYGFGPKAEPADVIELAKKKTPPDPV